MTFATCHAVFVPGATATQRRGKETPAIWAIAPPGSGPLQGLCQPQPVRSTGVNNILRRAYSIPMTIGSTSCHPSHIIFSATYKMIASPT